MINAIREGQSTDTVSKQEIFDILEGHGNNPVLAAFSFHTHNAAVKVCVIDGQSAKFIQTDAGGIKHLQNSPVTDAGEGS